MDTAEKCMVVSTLAEEWAMEAAGAKSTAEAGARDMAEAGATDMAEALVGDPVEDPAVAGTERSLVRNV